MGIDDEVWDNAVLCPRHVFLCVGDANGSLLPMPTGELVTHLWDSDGPHLSMPIAHQSSQVKSLCDQ